ncbi:MAG: hypothetical protein Q9194_007418, partial [Teloschistes cf. exilis]
ARNDRTPESTTKKMTAIEETESNPDRSPDANQQLCARCQRSLRVDNEQPFRVWWGRLAFLAVVSVLAMLSLDVVWIVSHSAKSMTR